MSRAERMLAALGIAAPTSFAPAVVKAGPQPKEAHYFEDDVSVSSFTPSELNVLAGVSVNAVPVPVIEVPAQETIERWVYKTPQATDNGQVIGDSEEWIIDDPEIGNPANKTPEVAGQYGARKSRKRLFLDEILVSEEDEPRSSENKDHDVEDSEVAMPLHVAGPSSPQGIPTQADDPKERTSPIVGKLVSKKRPVNPENWKSHKAKALRNSGQAYVSSRGKEVPERKIRKGCDMSCRFQCCVKMTEDIRQQLFSRFWKLGEYVRQLDYITKIVSEKDKATSTTDGQPKRKKTRLYSFLIDGKKVKVCKTMFVDTLSISEGMITTALSKQGPDSTLSPDKRGRHDSTNRLKTGDIQKSVLQHISLFDKVESHYCRKDTAKQYLSQELSVPKMHQMYLDWAKKEAIAPLASERQYRDIFNACNLSFHKPKKDYCDKCYALKNSTGVEKDRLTVELRDHLEKKQKAQDLKTKHKADATNDPTISMACFDLEKQLDVPKGTASAFYYKRKLILHNFTIFDCGQRQGHCYMWTEDKAKRGSNEIGTCLSLFVGARVEQGVREFRFFSDNCSGQNKNRNIFALYAYLAAKHNISITHTFLEVGHTQNEGDSMHALIERRSKNIEIFSPDQWYSLVRGAKRDGKPYIILEMNFDMVKDLKDLSGCFNWIHKDVNWREIRQLKVDGQRPFILLVKKELDGADTEVHLHKKGRAVNLENYCFKNAYATEVGIKKAKKTDLLSLCTSGDIPSVYHGFYHSLKEVAEAEIREENEDEL